MQIASKLSYLACGAVIALAAVASYNMITAHAAPECRQNYPNIPGKVILENDKFIVQRFVFPPGQWEGVHAHPPHQIYIHIKGGKWKVRYGERVQTVNSPTGSAGFFGPVRLSEDHESMNVGDEPIDLVWVTLKEGCR